MQQKVLAYDQKLQDDQNLCFMCYAMSLYIY